MHYFHVNMLLRQCNPTLRHLKGFARCSLFLLYKHSLTVATTAGALNHIDGGMCKQKGIDY